MTVKSTRARTRSTDTAVKRLERSEAIERLERFERLISFSRLGIRCRQRRLQSQLIGHRLLDDGVLEEVRVVARVQTRGVGERELPEILLRHEALLHQLEGFRNHLPEIGHVEMRKVGAEDRPQPDAHTGIEDHIVARSSASQPK